MNEIEAFIETSRSISDPAGLHSLLANITCAMGFDHFALIHRVDLSPTDGLSGHITERQLVALSNYPEAWIAEYASNNLVADDPVLLACQHTNVGFVWSDIPKLIDLTPAQQKQLTRGKKAGLADGFTGPSNDPGEQVGSCSFAVKEAATLPTGAFMTAHLVGSYAFQAANSMVKNARKLKRDQIRLSPRQLDCIALVGKGKSDWEIGRILGLSENTVKDYLDDARKKYDVGKRIQLVIRAVYDGHLPLTACIH